MKMSSWVPRLGAATVLLLLVGSGCMKDLDALSRAYGHAGGGGKAGHAGSSGKGGGSSASAGMEEGGVGGEAGEPSSGGSGDTGGSGNTGGTSPSGGSSGSGGTSGGGTCKDCGDQCIDISVGTPDGADSVTNCGDCDVTCVLDNAQSSTCSGGACVPKCKTNFGNCNAATPTNDGCETDLTTPANCGACKNVCSVVGVDSAACTAGKCMPTCTPRYADCNGNTATPPNDGCEFFLEALDHCTTGCTDAFVACSPTQVCNAAACVAPDGIVVLSTPLTADTNSATRYSDVFTTGPFNLEGTTITVRVYAPGATGGTLNVFLSDNKLPNTAFGPEYPVDLAVLSQKWTDITIPCQSSGAFDATAVKQINLRIQGAAGSVTSPTVLYVDSVRTSNKLVQDTFPSDIQGFAKSSFVAVAGSSPPTWIAAMP